MEVASRSYFAAISAALATKPCSKGKPLRARFDSTAKFAEGKLWLGRTPMNTWTGRRSKPFEYQTSMMDLAAPDYVINVSFRVRRLH